MDNLNARAAAAAATTTSTGPVAGVGGLSIVTPTKSPEAESETPPPRIQSTKPYTFSNGVLKRHAPAQVVYKECRKNHAASLGGHALDGCGEFMPAPTATASDPTSLKCAACGCHRNFHRHEPEDSSTNTGALAHVIEYHPHHRHHPLPPPQTAPPAVASRGARSPGSQSPPPISSSYYPGSAPHMLLALSTGGVGGNGAEVNNNGPHPLHHHPSQHSTQHLMHLSNSQPPSRKRFRTRFTQEQKDKMHDFAEKVGWKMQKTNEDMVNGFCNEIGVERGVFKVWMHNNKNTFGKIRSNTTTTTSTDVALNCGNTNPSDVGDHNNNPTGTDEEDELANLNGNGNSNSSSINNSTHHHDHHIHHHHDQHQHHQQYNGKRSNESNAPTNGSSSSS